MTTDRDRVGGLRAICSMPGYEGLCETLRRYLEWAPLAWAMPRAQEAVFLKRFALPSPVLDLGCGDGLFAWLSGALEGAVGVELAPREARRAAARRVYRTVGTADAGRLPFAARTVGSVVSISTLEHIPELDRVLAEIARVLRPGGAFVCSMPGPAFGPALFWPRLLRALRCEGIARGYVGFVHRTFGHINLLS